MITPDSSVTIAAAAAWHTGHEVAVEALEHDDVALAVHVAFETTAALSRMPEGHRVAPDLVLDWMERRFPTDWLGLPPDAARSALRAAVAGGIRGGALYDALVGATAAHHHRILISADRRAAATYRLVGVVVTEVGEPLG